MAQSPQALARLAEKQRSHRLAERTWKPEDKPDWLDEVAYVGQIQPRLADVTISTIALALEVSLPYASDIRAGRRRPHLRHWQALAQLVRVSPPREDANRAGNCVSVEDRRDAQKTKATAKE
jgi:hypothetical protein